MSVFNYHTRADPLEVLRSRVGKIEKLIKALKFWEVNDTALGDDVFKRRKVTPNLGVGVVGRGPWFKVDMGAGTGVGGIDYDHIYIGGIEYTPGANPSNYDFLQVGTDGSSSWIPAMISPMPTGFEIFNVTKNHIHITGATAGNI